MKQRNDHKKGCLCCSAPAKHQAMITEAIEKVGFAVIPVTNQEPHIAYTVGLTETLGCPELFMTHAMDVMDLGKVLREAGLNLIDACKGKSKQWIKELFEQTDIPCMMKLLTVDGPKFAWTGCRPIITVQYLDELGMARRRYGDKFKAVQIYMPDNKGKLQWHIGFDVVWGRQAAQTPMHILTTIDNEQHVGVAECQSCRMTLPGLAKCSRCKTVCYCDEACQRKDWSAHKQLCGKADQ